jgi:hypothetical protein
MYRVEVGSHMNEPFEETIRLLNECVVERKDRNAHFCSKCAWRERFFSLKIAT